MTTLIKNSVTHFSKILRVYTVLALVGAGVAVAAQLGASLRDYYFIEYIALIIGIMFICFLLVIRARAGEVNRWINAMTHVYRSPGNKKNKTQI